MNPLEAIRDKLKVKPLVQSNKGVVVNIGQVSKDKDTQAPVPLKITVDKDDGRRALEIAEKIKQHGMTQTKMKFQVPPEESKAPIIPDAKKKKKKIKPLLILNEDNEADEVAINHLPEGGPRVEIEGVDEGIIEVEGIKEVEDAFVIEPQKTKKRISTKVKKGIIHLGPKHMIQIGDASLATRLPPLPIFDVRIPSYYMNNREVFINFINQVFEPYKEDLLDDTKGISCEDIGKDTGSIDLLTHQKIVRSYMNLHTPYRGLLLYHGLGSGKTCSSIAIAEGIKSGGKKVIIMTPASLKRNYIEEIKKCGDLLFRKKQFWEWISTDENPELMDALSSALGLSVEFIRKTHGAWLVNVKKENNYSEFTTSDKKSLNNQLDEMIENKYKFINYNGLRREKFRELTNNYENNIFDNSIVVIDEAHNFVSRIVNKINNISKFAEKNRGPNALLPTVLSLQLYEFLLRAENNRIVLLTGTPIINYPNEIGVLFNILRGYIKTWHFALNAEGNNRLSKEILLNIFSTEKIIDYVDYVPSSKTLTITRNPYGFENKISTTSGYKGVTNEPKNTNLKEVKEERGTVTDTDFIKRIVKLLKANDITAIANSTTFTVNTALPDTLEEFNNIFINEYTGNVKNIDKFKRRIIGLTSYFRSAQEELLPKYDKNFDRHAIIIPMSDYQFKVYEKYRQDERITEQPKRIKKEDEPEPSSTYRIFSRLACNFVMPVPPGRPIPSELRFSIENNKKQDLKMYKVAVTKRLKAKELKGLVVEPAAPNVEAFVAPGPKTLNKMEVKAREKAIKDSEKEAKRLDKETEKLEKEKMKESKRLEKEAKELEKEAKKLEKEAKKLDKAKGITIDDLSDQEDELSGNELSDEEDAYDALIGGAGDEEQGKGEPENPFETIINVQNDAMRVTLTGYKDQDAIDREIDELEGDELLETMGDSIYRDEISKSMKYLREHKHTLLSLKGLETYSPKFLAMIENIQDPEHIGLHLIYSQFRSMEGIGIFAIALEANGFAQFKIKRSGAYGWELNMSEEDLGKPCYALYTGTEDSDEREIIRNVYNGSWDAIPNNIAAQLKAKSSNNNMGEIITILMITSAGSEGINLRNTRYVHIMEPYWHPVRTEQVIGRARRICSHQELAKELQTVEVFIYIMTFTKKQLDSEYAIELKLKDTSKIAPYLPQSSDEKLYEISNIKEQLTSQLLTGIKEAAIDCATHSKSTSKEGLTCLSFGRPDINDFAFNPNYAQDENDTVAAINKVANDWQAQTIKVSGKRYSLKVGTRDVYDYDSVIQAKSHPGVMAIYLGKLQKNEDGEYIIKKSDL